jgi:hypothetical protein
MGDAARAVWRKFWERGVGISIEFFGLDAGNDRCAKPGCDKIRKLHRRKEDHKFQEES